MSYRFDVDESAAAAVRRIADEQLGAARASLASAGGGDTASAVHDCRKRCKKLRGLVRLVRPALGKQYKAVNAALRDAARERLDAAGRSLSALTLDRDDPAAIRSGAKKTWKRGRSALAAVREVPDPARFHEWRKRAKYTGYHLKLLSDAAPSLLRPQRVLGDLARDRRRTRARADPRTRARQGQRRVGMNRPGDRPTASR